jgi:hypothetical protein
VRLQWLLVLQWLGQSLTLDCWLWPQLLRRREMVWLFLWSLELVWPLLLLQLRLLRCWHHRLQEVHIHRLSRHARAGTDSGWTAANGETALA